MPLFSLEETESLAWLAALAVTLTAMALGVIGLVRRELWRRTWVAGLGACLLTALLIIAVLDWTTLLEPGFDQARWVLTFGGFLLGMLASWRPLRHLFAARSAIMSIVLILAGAALAAELGWRINATRPGELDIVELAAGSYARETIHPRTDQATAIAPCAYKLVEGSEAALQRHLRMQQADAASKAIQVAPADMRYNCHGWVFTDGAYAIHQESLKPILLDNNYRMVDQPREGDIVLYFESTHGAILHSGLVRAATADGFVLVESKWGAGGRYLHTPDVQPYSASFMYLRSPRAGHMLAGLGSAPPDRTARAIPKKALPRVPPSGEARP